MSQVLQIINASPFFTPTRKFAFGLLIIILGLLFDSFFNGPEQIVMKYDFSGNPIHFAKREVYVGFHLAYLAFVNVILVSLMILFRKTKNLKLANIPNKSFWMKPENQMDGLCHVNTLLDIVLIFVFGLTLTFMMAARFHLTGQAINILLFGVVGATIGLGFWIFRLFSPTLP